MKVRPGGVARPPDARNGLAAQHAIAWRDQVFQVVRVNRDETACMADEHEVAVAALFAGEQHFALLRREHRCSLRTGEVQPVVMLAIARPEPGDDHAPYRPGERLTGRGGIQCMAAGARNLRRGSAVWPR